ncbi:MAG: hypothetical protein IKT31_06855, partial [Firmicutes bacterium]|nr:hypothetical protein [Bacillota bacterium]
CNDTGVLLRVKQILNDTKSKNVTALANYDKELYFDETVIYVKTEERAVTYAYTHAGHIIYISDYGFVDQIKIEAMIASTKTGWNM